MTARLALVLIVALVCLADRSVAQTAVESHGIAAKLPGIRYVASGQIEFAQGGKTTISKAGDYFFEVVPVEWKGPSAIPPRS